MTGVVPPDVSVRCTLGFTFCHNHGVDSLYLLSNLENEVHTCCSSVFETTHVDWVYDPLVKCIVHIGYFAHPPGGAYTVPYHLSPNKYIVDCLNDPNGKILVGNALTYEPWVEVSPGNIFNKEFWLGCINDIRLAPYLTYNEYKTELKISKLALTFLCSLNRFAEKEGLNIGGCRDTGGLIISFVVYKRLFRSTLGIKRGYGRRTT
jgi:hypothetical protein